MQHSDPESANFHQQERAEAHRPKAAQPRGSVAHRTRGRIRLQFPKQDRHALDHMSAQLRKMSGVREVEVRPSTGSVVIHHDTEAPDFLPMLQDFVQETTLFLFEGDLDAKSASTHLTAVEKDAHYLIEHSKLGESVLRYAEHLNRAVKQLTDGWVDLRVLLPASIAVCALLVIEVESSPLWIPLAFFSFQAFTNLHQPRASTIPQNPTPQLALPAAVDLPSQ